MVHLSCSLSKERASAKKIDFLGDRSFFYKYFLRTCTQDRGDYTGNGYIHENYFKTGNYFGWNDDYEKAAQVVLHKVLTEHR